MPVHDDLIFDIGMHVGNDADYYLKKGFRVVAVEADSELVEQCRARFGQAIADGRLVIEEGAICDETLADASGFATFYVNRNNSQWSTVSPEVAEINVARGAPDMREIKVRVLSCAELFARHGTPHYVKIDIEGADSLCLDTIAALQGKPRFVSLESDKVSYDNVCEELRKLNDAGYRRFALVQQAWIKRQSIDTRSRDGTPLHYAFQRASSGPFGEDLPEGGWMSRADAERQYRRIFREYWLLGDRRHRHVRLMAAALGRVWGRPLPGWYDTHARLD